MMAHRNGGTDGVGRRADAPPAKREIVLTLRVNDAERRQIERVAKRHGIGVSTLLRAAALDLDDDQRLRSVAGADDRPAESPEMAELRDELKALRMEWKGRGSNLNQLTRLSNAEGIVQTQVVIGGERVLLADLLVSVRDDARAVLTNLGARGHG